MSWAKLPSRWVRPITEQARNGEDHEIYPLSYFKWRKDGASSMAALLILIALAIRLNKSQMGEEFKPGKARPTSIAITYDELQRMTGFARGPVASGIDLLEDVKAIKRVKVGRANHYELLGVGENGKWCQVPQAKLLSGDDALKLKAMPRKRTALNGLKLYMALMALRRQHTNTTSISYDGITKWTGIRRQDIPAARGWLVAEELITISEELDDRHLKEQDRATRYRISGLSAMKHQSAAA